jgi:Peptidase family M23
MRYYILLLLVATVTTALAQPPYQISGNVYRIPYDNGTQMTVSRDHFTHTHPNFDVTGRYDLVGFGQGSGCNVYRLVAAAPGIIRRIVDTHNIRPPDCDPDCSDFNNYVWIEHANGEWSKYTHMKQNSVTQDAGLIVGDTVCAGTFLGYECDVGQADGRHLHFEVRHPNDPANVVISVAGGGMQRADALHYVPVINSISKHYLEDEDSWAGSGSNACTNTNITVPAITIQDSGFKIYMASSDIITNNNQVLYQNGSNGMLHAGNSITITPGFWATAGSYFHARIGNCGPTAFPGGCN